MDSDEPLVERDFYHEMLQLEADAELAALLAAQPQLLDQSTPRAEEKPCHRYWNNVLRKPRTYVECSKISPSDGLLAIRLGYCLLDVQGTKIFYRNSNKKFVYKEFRKKYKTQSLSYIHGFLPALVDEKSATHKSNYLLRTI